MYSTCVSSISLKLCEFICLWLPLPLAFLTAPLMPLLHRDSPNGKHVNGRFYSLNQQNSDFSRFTDLIEFSSTFVKHIVMKKLNLLKWPLSCSLSRPPTQPGMSLLLLEQPPRKFFLNIFLLWCSVTPNPIQSTQSHSWPQMTFNTLRLHCLCHKGVH